VISRHFCIGDYPFVFGCFVCLWDQLSVLFQRETIWEKKWCSTFSGGWDRGHYFYLLVIEKRRACMQVVGNHAVMQRIAKIYSPGEPTLHGITSAILVSFNEGLRFLCAL